MYSQFIKSAIKPANDYYTYVNNLWLDTFSVDKSQKYIVEVDNFRLTQDKVYKDLHKIILDYIKNNNTKLSQNMKYYYDSVIKMNEISYSRLVCKEILNKIDVMRENKNNLWKLLAFVNSNEMISPYAPLSWSLTPDDKSPTTYRCSIHPFTFPVTDLSVYYDDGTDEVYKQKFKKSYIYHLDGSFKIIFGKNHGFNIKDIVDIQCELYKAFSCTPTLDKNTSTYNRIYLKDAKDKYNFDWEEFSKELGFKKPPTFFITSNVSYLKCCTDLLIKNWDSDKWRTFWIWMYVVRLVRLTRHYEKFTYDFLGKFERGQEEIIKSPDVSASLYMSLPFNHFLSVEYLKKYKKPEDTEYVTILCNDLKIVFETIIKKNTWLSPSTKKYALLKLKYLTFIVGVPDNIPKDPEIDYSDNLYDNLIKLMTWRHKMFIGLEGEKVLDLPYMDWTNYPIKMTGSQLYIVNASYTPSKNSIYINQGYIQPPFVDNSRGIEYNLALIGYTISHEMSHALDDWGSKYDYKGRLYDWWTKEDTHKFKLKQLDVIKQYEEFAKRDGIQFDASIGIGEDLADISAMAISSYYLRDYQASLNIPFPVRADGLKLFYVVFAMQQRQYINKNALSAQLKTNPHPLDKYRCNVPLSRNGMFRALYGVTKQDGMWWHNTDSIW